MTKKMKISETRKNNKLYEQNGLKFISESDNSKYGVFRFISCNHIQKIRFDHAKSGDFTCRECSENKLKLEAVKVELLLVGPGKNSRYRTYEFPNCHHQQEIRLDHVRTRQFKCNQCLIDKLKIEAAEHNFMLIGNGKDNRHKLYECNVCHHQQELKITSVRNGIAKCSKCIFNIREQEAKKVGLRVVKNSERDGYMYYEFKECKHIQEIQISKVRKNCFRCEECLNIRLKEEALKAGLILKGSGKTSSTRLYEFQTCHHLQEIEPAAVRKGTFTCRECYEELLKEEARQNNLILHDPCDVVSGKRKYEFEECHHKKYIYSSHVREGNFKCKECEGFFLSNGIQVRSQLEKIIGNELITNSIKFDYETRISMQSLHRTDFFLTDYNIFIEVVGFDYNYRGYFEKLKYKIENFYVGKKFIPITKNQIQNKTWKSYLYNILKQANSEAIFNDIRKEFLLYLDCKITECEK